MHVHQKAANSKSHFELADNRGESAGLYFFRDRHGLEADLVIEDGPAITVIETKSGQTVTNDMLSSVRRVASALKEAGKIATVVVHGGNEPQLRGGIDVLPWSRLHERHW